METRLATSKGKNVRKGTKGFVETPKKKPTIPTASPVQATRSIIYATQRAPRDATPEEISKAEGATVLRSADIIQTVRVIESLDIEPTR